MSDGLVHFHRASELLLPQRDISATMTDDSDNTSSDTDTDGGGSGGDVDSDSLSGRRNLAGAKDATRQVSNAASKDQGDSPQASKSRPIKKSGSKDTPEADAAPSADSRSIPRSVDPNEPSSTSDGGDGGSSSQSDE